MGSEHLLRSLDDETAERKFGPDADYPDHGAARRDRSVAQQDAETDYNHPERRQRVEARERRCGDRAHGQP